MPPNSALPNQEVNYGADGYEQMAKDSTTNEPKIVNQEVIVINENETKSTLIVNQNSPGECPTNHEGQSIRIDDEVPMAKQSDNAED